MPISAAMIGRAGAAAVEHVEDRWLMNYAASVHDSTPVYYDNLGGKVLAGHPAYVSHLEWDAITSLHQQLHELTEDERLLGVHSYNHTLLGRAVRSGDKLTSVASVAGVEPGRSGARLTVRTETTDSDGDVIALSFTSSVFRGIHMDGDRRIPDMPMRQMPIAGADSHKTRQIVIDQLAPYVFSECARDYGIIHTDIDAATRAGLPGLILHGTGTIAYALSDVVHNELGDDPTVVAGFQANLRAMVLCPSQVRLDVFNDRSHGTIWFDLYTPQGGKAISGGAVFVRQHAR